MKQTFAVNRLSHLTGKLDVVNCIHLFLNSFLTTQPVQCMVGKVFDKFAKLHKYLLAAVRFVSRILKARHGENAALLKIIYNMQAT